MNTTRTVGWALGLALVATIGCSHQSAESPPVIAAPAASGETSTEPKTMRPPSQASIHRMDAASALLSAAEQLSLGEPRRSTVRTLEENVEASGRAIASAFQMLHADLAAAVRTGNIDPAKVQADETVLANAVQTHTVQEVDALNGLHAILNPSERETAVAEVRSGQSGRAEEQAGGQPGKSREARLDRLTRELGLDHDQRQRVSALLSASPASGPDYRAALERRFDDVLNGFSSDHFDARTTIQASAPSPAEMIRQRVQQETAFLSQLIPILRPDQREKLATNLEQSDRMSGHHGKE
jgi:Spy/CpxP family protein refolding chaperone